MRLTSGAQHLILHELVLLVYTSAAVKSSKMPWKSLWLHLTLLLRKLVRTFPQLVSGKSLASTTTQKWGLIEYKS